MHQHVHPAEVCRPLQGAAITCCQHLQACTEELATSLMLQPHALNRWHLPPALQLQVGHLCHHSNCLMQPATTICHTSHQHMALAAAQQVALRGRQTKNQSATLSCKHTCKMPLLLQHIKHSALKHRQQHSQLLYNRTQPAGATAKAAQLQAAAHSCGWYC